MISSIFVLIPMLMVAAYCAPAKQDLTETDIRLTAEYGKQVTWEAVNDMCKSKKYENLKSCQLYHKDSNKLDSIVDQYRHIFSKVNENETNLESTQLWGEVQPVNTILNSQAFAESSQQASTTSTCSLNPCIGGYSDVTFYFGIDFFTNEIRELVYSPANFLYQRFLIGVCSNYATPGHTCCGGEVVYHTLVYKSSTSLEVELRFVKVIGTCALSI